MASYAILFVIVMLLFGGLLTMSLSKPVNEFIGVVNPYIADGSVSTQFVTYWNFIIGLLIASPILLAVAVSAWGYVRAIERRNEEV